MICLIAHREHLLRKLTESLRLAETTSLINWPDERESC
jgi:hypothetical protein